MKQSLLAIGTAITLILPAHAQQAPPTPPQSTTGIRSFSPEFFVQFSPVTALDMVQRIPGFSIQGGNDRRGFGENAGNVLIDGNRPSTKSDDILTVLGRIPAAQVDRIELSEQAGADSETSGQAQVVNVIRKAGNAISGTYEGHIKSGTRYGLVAYVSGSVTAKRGATTYELNAGSYDDRLQGSGPERFYTIVGGQRILNETRTYLGRGGYTEFDLGGSINTVLGGTKINFNAKAAWSNGFDRRTGIYTSGLGANSGNELLSSKEPNRDFEWEAGGDIEFSLAPKLNSKLVALYRTEQDKSTASIETQRPATATTMFETVNRNRPTEAVFRIQNDWTGLSRHTLQFGVELAYNKLKSRFLGTGRSNGAISSTSQANVVVEETRIEPFIADIWSLSDAWKIESGAIFELSQLRLSGDSIARRQFRFVKPRITATWTANTSTTLEFKATHQVAQLNFNEFATSVDLSQGNQVDSGNRDLVPEKETTFSALIRHKFFDRGSIQLEGSYQLLRDTQDLVPIPNGNGGFFDGAGNIGSSRRWNAELEIMLPFDWLTKPIGITGMELKYVGHYHGSAVTDPVTLERRQIAFRPEWHQNWSFRHDITKAGIAWGFEVKAAAPRKAYFANLYRWERTAPRADIFLEYRKFKYGTVRLKVFDLPHDSFYRTRFVYAGGRRSGVPTQIIERNRILDPRIQLSLIGKF